MSPRLPLCLTLALAFAATAAGQIVITLHPVNVTGDIVQIGQRGVVVKAGDGRNWTLNVSNKTRVKVTGTALPELVKPPLCALHRIDRQAYRPLRRQDRQNHALHALGWSSLPHTRCGTGVEHATGR